MNQRIGFLEVLVKYAVTFYLDVNLSVLNNFKRAVSWSLGAVGMGISKRLEFSIDERISLPYLNSAPTYSVILLIAVIYLSACLLSLQSKM